jgi:hypothetical protein
MVGCEPPATEMVITNRGPRAAIERPGMARAADFYGVTPTAPAIALSPGRIAAIADR